MATYVFYDMNDHLLAAPEDPAYDLVITASTGAVDIEFIATTLAGRARPI